MCASEVDLHVQIPPGGPPFTPMLTFAEQPDAIALVDPRRDLDGQRLVLLDATGATTGLAGVGNESAVPWHLWQVC